MSKQKPGNWNKRKSTKDYVDIDYYNSLSDSEKQFMDQFVREYYHACFSKTGDDLHPTEKRREIYGANNARNRDMFSKWDRVDGDCSDLPSYDED